VRGIKHNQETNAKGGRSRLCVVGINHQEGKEYSRKEAPTPMFATVLILIGEATVKRGINFKFDLTQFYCDSPEQVCLIPPRAHQRDEHGQKVYWVLDKWLQGAKGAGYSARMQIIAILEDNDLICFTISNWDHCLFIHQSDRGQCRFALHVHDGCGGWASTRELAISLYTLLHRHYPQIKW
jgi:hypothetical protein